MVKTSIALFSLLLLLKAEAVIAAPCPKECRDGSIITLPDKTLHFPPLPPLTCADLAALAAVIGVEEFSAECNLSQRTESICGCPRPADSCDLCPDGSTAPNTNTELPEFGKIFLDAVFTCETVEAYLHSFPKENEVCLSSQRAAAIACGCPVADDDIVAAQNGTTSSAGGDIFGLDLLEFDDFKYSTFGATTPAKLTQLHTMLHSSAALSIVGALLVIHDTIRFKKRRNNLYNQIVAIMAGFDIIYSVAVALIHIPRPNDLAISSGTEMGNKATCRAQGFFTHWGGLTSLFLNASLSTYYLLVIVYRARHSRLEKGRKWMLGLPIVLGFVLACASIPFIAPSSTGCSIVPPTASLIRILKIDGFHPSWGPFLALVIVPGYLVLAYTTIALGRVYWYVRTISNQAGRWRSTRRASQFVQASGTTMASSSIIEVKRKRTRKKKRNTTNRLQKEVFMQCAMYLAALYFVWFILLWMSLSVDKYIGGKHYALWNFLFFLDPLQGFLNAIIYFRPRLSRAVFQLWKDHKGKISFRRCYLCCTKNGTASGGVLAGGDVQQDDEDADQPARQSYSSIREAEPAADLVDMNEAPEEEENLYEDTEEKYEARNPSPSTVVDIESVEEPAAASEREEEDVDQTAAPVKEEDMLSNAGTVVN